MSELTREQVMQMTTDIARWTGNHSQPIAQYLNAIDRNDAAQRKTIQQQAEELTAYRNGGVTEDILRKHDGSIKIGKGCVIVREDEYEQQAERIKALEAELARLNGGNEA